MKREIDGVIKKEVYVCEYCHNMFNNAEEARACEKNHKKTTGVKGIHDFGSSDYPPEVVVSFSDGAKVHYVLAEKWFNSLVGKERIEKEVEKKNMIGINDKEELLGQLIDIFEGFLDIKGIVIPNPTRDEEAEYDNSANIYGEDYDLLRAEIESTLEEWDILEPETKQGE